MTVENSFHGLTLPGDALYKVNSITSSVMSVAQS